MGLIGRRNICDFGFRGGDFLLGFNKESKKFAKCKNRPQLYIRTLFIDGTPHGNERWISAGTPKSGEVWFSGKLGWSWESIFQKPVKTVSLVKTTTWLQRISSVRSRQVNSVLFSWSRNQVLSPPISAKDLNYIPAEILFGEIQKLYHIITHFFLETAAKLKDRRIVVGCSKKYMISQHCKKIIGSSRQGFDVLESWSRSWS